jgi:hypothetical protein
MTRRTFSMLPLVAGVQGAPAAVTLENRNHRIELDRTTGQLLSLRASAAPRQEFIEPAGPRVFVIQYLDEHKEFRQIASSDARSISVQESTAELFKAEFRGLAGLDLDAEVTVSNKSDEDASRWSITIHNRSGILITDVQFPFIVVRYNLGGQAGSEALLQPFAVGRLLRAPQPPQMQPDSPFAWQIRPENGDSGHYPGLTFAQFLAYYNDRAGIYVACEDASGAVKLIKPVHCGTGIRLGFAHVGDWHTNGSRPLGYDVVVRTFTGDWYDAADLYRRWTLEQPWARLPLHKRTDIPAWLTGSPAHVVFRIQGQLDAGPAPPIPQFLPYTKIVPLAQRAAEKLNAPVVPVIMSWERPGPWVYPDCFPPAGGDQSLREFTQAARDRGWHVGTYCNGTRWVTGHYWSGYDGEKYFNEHGGEQSVSRTHDGQRWSENWDRAWRPSYACCAGSRVTVEIAEDFVQHLLDDGLDWIQYLDQNVSCSTFPCYSSSHGHAPVPGRWMTAAMEELLRRLRARAAKAGRPVVFSVENAPNEYFLSKFDICDIRVIPPGHAGYERNFLPLWNYLYHEFTLIQGAFGAGPDPFYTVTRNAYNLVTGAMPAGVIDGKGRLMNREAFPWASWEPFMGSEEDVWQMYRTALALRRGKGREYLVLGRMQRPSNISGIAVKTWIEAERRHRIPAVFHGAWHNPAGKFAVVAANWTSEAQSFQVRDERLGGRCSETLSSAKGIAERTREAGPGAIEVSLPALSCALIESL